MATWAWAPWVIAGIGLGALFLRLAGLGDAGRERWRIGIGLVVAAAVYLVFAAAEGDALALVIAAGGVLLFAVVAHQGVWVSPAYLAAGWGAHAVWDAALHLATPASPATAPGWYAALCLGFDVLVAVGVVGRGRRLAVESRVPGSLSVSSWTERGEWRSHER